MNALIFFVFNVLLICCYLLFEWSTIFIQVSKLKVKSLFIKLFFVLISYFISNHNLLKYLFTFSIKCSWNVNFCCVRLLNRRNLPTLKISIQIHCFFNWVRSPTTLFYLKYQAASKRYWYKEIISFSSVRISALICQFIIRVAKYQIPFPRFEPKFFLSNQLRH